MAFGAALCADDALAGEDMAVMPPPLSLAQSGFALRVPATEAVVFHGVVGHDAEAGRASSMLYMMPAGAGVAGLFAAILAHGTVAEASRRDAISKAQEEADTVLAPYRDVLAHFSHRDLMQQALDHLSDAGDKKVLLPGDSAPDGWVVESTPVFTMTQDRSALVLDNTIVVHVATVSDPVYRTVVRVVSDPHAAPDLEAVWLAGSGQALTDESAQLLAHSLHILLQTLDAAPGYRTESPHKTFRYSEGNVPKTERAQLVEHLCDRTVIKTLRGWLMSIPQPRAASEASASSDPAASNDACKTAPRYPS